MRCSSIQASFWRHWLGSSPVESCFADFHTMQTVNRSAKDLHQLFFDPRDIEYANKEGEMVATPLCRGERLQRIAENATHFMRVSIDATNATRGDQEALDGLLAFYVGLEGGGRLEASHMQIADEQLEYAAREPRGIRRGADAAERHGRAGDTWDEASFAFRKPSASFKPPFVFPVDRRPIARLLCRQTADRADRRQAAQPAVCRRATAQNRRMSPRRRPQFRRFSPFSSPSPPSSRRMSPVSDRRPSSSAAYEPFSTVNDPGD